MLHGQATCDTALCLVGHDDILVRQRGDEVLAVNLPLGPFEKRQVTRQLEG